MIKQDNLISLYKTNTFQLKKTYELNDFYNYLSFDNIYKIPKIGYKSINNEIIKDDFNILEIPSFFKKKELLSKDFNICLIHSNLSLFVLIQKYNKGFVDIDYLKEQLSVNFNILFKSIKKNKKNTTFFVSNKNSIEFPRDKELYPRLNEFRDNLGINLLEIPYNYKMKETFDFFKDLEKFINKIKLKKFNVNFRIRKIFKYNVNGMFFVDMNTIVIDPRKPEKIIHEIGHYIYENGLAFTLNGKRIYKHQFPSIIKKNKNKYELKLSKYEDYQEDSEIFACWFEENCSY